MQPKSTGRTPSDESSNRRNRSDSSTSRGSQPGRRDQSTSRDSTDRGVGESGSDFDSTP